VPSVKKSCPSQRHRTPRQSPLRTRHDLPQHEVIIGRPFSCIWVKVPCNYLLPLLTIPSLVLHT
jgi:hypothetical protein